MTHKNISALNWFLLFFLAAVWGSSFIMMKKAMLVFSPVQVGCLRIFIAFLSLIPFIFPRVKEIKKEQWKYLAAVGLLGSGIPVFLFTIAQQHIDSAVAGILNSLTPLFALSFGLLFFKAKYNWVKISGVLVGLIGAVVIVLFKSNGEHETNYWYALLVVLATMMYATNVNILKVKFQEANPVTITIGVFLVMGPPAGIWLFSTDFLQVVKTNPQSYGALGYMCILAFLGTSYSWILMNRLLQQTNVLFASTTTYLIPIVAVMWGVIDGESIAMMHIAGMLLILVGVYLTSR